MVYILAFTHAIASAIEGFRRSKHACLGFPSDPALFSYANIRQALLLAFWRAISSLKTNAKSSQKRTKNAADKVLQMRVFFGKLAFFFGQSRVIMRPVSESQLLKFRVYCRSLLFGSKNKWRYHNLIHFLKNTSESIRPFLTPSQMIHGWLNTSFHPWKLSLVGAKLSLFIANSKRVLLP